MLEAKKSLRAEMRAIRKALPDRAERSARIWRDVQQLAAMQRATTVLVFDTIPGEPHTAPFIEWCQAEGKTVAAPEDDVDPSWPDVIIVPGLAFTRSGERVGQGGGWYDRFLSKISPGSTTIGVCFEPQIVESVPTEDHDIALNIVIAA
jgi:5-formyltetrahydrofolate cyclo-ligase